MKLQNPRHPTLDPEKSRTPGLRSSSLLVTSLYDPRRKWLPTPVFLPREPHGQRRLAGYSPQGRKKSDTTEPLTQAYCVLQGLFFQSSLMVVAEMCGGQMFVGVSASSTGPGEGHGHPSPQHRGQQSKANRKQPQCTICPPSQTRQGPRAPGLGVRGGGGRRGNVSRGPRT